MKKFASLFRILFINILVLYFFLYIFEIYLQTNNRSLFEETPYYKFKKISQEGTTIPMIRPTHIKDNHSVEIVPVSGISNTKTLLCYDGDKPIIYKSDYIGFSNEIVKKDIDAILVGDSFAHGYCVKKESRFNSQFKKMGIETINFGMGGNGPLLSFASLVEYQELFNFNTVVLFFTPENDYGDFQREKTNLILKKYLDINFKQNLISKNKQKDKLYYDYIKKRDRPFREFLRRYHIDLSLIRKKIRNINLEKKDFDTNYNLEIPRSVNLIFKNFKNFSEKNKKNLLIVFNMLPPDILFGKTDDRIKKGIQLNKSFLEKEKINYFDYNDYIYNKYEYSNIHKIYKKRIRIDGGFDWDHYTEEGYRLLTEQIAIKIENIKNK